MATSYRIKGAAFWFSRADALCVYWPQKAYYEPSHGSAPDIAGQNIANPYSMIGSVAMMLEMSFGMKDEAQMVWAAMTEVFESGVTTSDLRGIEALPRQ